MPYWRLTNVIDNDQESPLGAPPFDLRHLRTFVAVAEQRHFARAAALLDLSQPAASKQIRRLELDIGAQLLRRTSRQVELTAAGEALLEDARRLLEQAGGLARHAQRISRGSIGRITVGFRDSAANDFLPHLIRRFREEYPDVELVLEECASGSEQLAALRHERIDAGFVRPPVDDRALKLDLLLDEPLVAVLPETHKLADHDEIALDALANEPFVLWPRHAHPAVYDATFGPGGALGFVPQVAHEAIGTLSVLGLVAAGLGVSLLPASVQAVTRRNVTLRPLAQPGPSLQLGIVHRVDDHSKPLANFIATAIDVARDARPTPTKTR
jgi:DNA-binding transcriptional LysR family regulator